MSDNLKRFTPEEVPDHLFTQTKLNMMGLAANADHVAFVVYPEQKNEFKLYDIYATRERKKQKGFSLVMKDMTIDEVLAERKHELKVRKNQLG
jgi:hypothetical protein